MSGEHEKWLATHITGSNPPWMQSYLDGLTQQPTHNGNGNAHNRSQQANDSWVTAAVGYIIDELRTTPEGGRNDTLNKSAYRLGQFIASGYLDEIHVRALLEDAARVCGLEDRETQRSIQSGLGAGKRNPAEIPPEQIHPSAVLDSGYADADNAPVTLVGRVLDRAQLATLPKPLPLIADTIDLGTVVVLVGHWGTCKSFLALDWASCIATGKPWQGRVAEQRKILYIAGEGAYGLDARLTSWEKGWGHPIDPTTFHVLPTPRQLGNAAQVAELCALVTDGLYGVVIVDTLAKCMVGLDENAAQDMGRIVNALYVMRNATVGGGGTVVAIHHTGKDKMTTRGSSALEDGVDCVYRTDGCPEELNLERQKRKDGPIQDQLRLRLSTVEYTDSAVLERFDTGSGAAITGKATDLLFTYHQYFKGIGCTGPQLFDVAQMLKPTFYKALKDLLEAGDLVNVGSDRSRFYRARGESHGGKSR